MSKMCTKKAKTTLAATELLKMIMDLRNYVRTDATNIDAKNKLMRHTVKLFNILLESEKNSYAMIAKGLPHASYRDPVAELEANIYLSVCEAVEGLESLDWAEVKRYVEGKFKAIVTDGAKRVDAHFQSDEVVPEEGFDHEFDAELSSERSRNILEYLKEMRELFNSPFSVFPANFDYVHEYSVPNGKYSVADIAFRKKDFGLSHDILYNRLADGTKITNTAWHVTGDILGALVNASRMLGKSSFSSAERKLLSQFASAPLVSPDYELALVQLEYCEDLLLGVLRNHETGKYVLQDSDPLNKLQVYELLGIIRQAINRYPEDYHDRVWDDVDDGVEDDAFGFRPENLCPLQDLITIAVNAALGFCNTGISLTGIADDILRAETADKNEDFDIVEALYQKNINRLHGFMVSYVIQHKGVNLPNTSLKRKSSKGSSKSEFELADTVLRKKLRKAVAESLGERLNLSKSLLKRYAE